MNRFLLVCLAVISSALFSQTPVAPTAGDGTSGNPYQIASLGNLYWIATSTANWNKFYIQTADIDAAETSGWFSNGSGGFFGWTPIGNGSSHFTGSYNGQNHIISNIYINRGSNDAVALFGSMNVASASISNLGITNSYVKGAGKVACLAGFKYNGTINNCYSTGTVIGSSYAGGLVGYNYQGSITNSYSSAAVTCSSHTGGLIGYRDYGSIYQCFSTGNVSGSYRTGGLVGFSWNGTITNCYSTGNVTGTGQFTGGLVGENYLEASIVNCYSKGYVTGSTYYGGLVGSGGVGHTFNSFWDTETSGQPNSSGGTGKTTADMKTQTTFTGSTWDFVNETANGTNDYWKMSIYNNDGYPYLSWQIYIPGTPQNMNIVSSSESPDINWDQVLNAESYKIYSSTDPYAEFPAGWMLEASGITITSWSDTNASTSDKKFYIVVAVN